MERNEFRPFDSMLEVANMDMRPNNSNKPMCNLHLNNFPIAMAYVPMQQWRKIYSNEVALDRGTIFEELDLPFMGRGGEEK